MLREQGVEAYNLDGGYMAWLMLAMQEPADQPDTDFAKDVEESIRKRLPEENLVLGSRKQSMNMNL